jgi:hypothetical protein
MADPATILGIASAGIKLSLTLHSFAAAIGSAGTEISQSAKDLAHFSSILNYLGEKMDEAHKAGFVTAKGFHIMEKIIVDCTSIFDELETMIKKATTTEKITVIKMDQEDFQVKEVNREKLNVSFGKRLLYLFQKAEIANQRNRLESLKSTLHILLSFLIFEERTRVFAAK